MIIKTKFCVNQVVWVVLKRMVCGKFLKYIEEVTIKEIIISYDDEPRYSVFEMPGFIYEDELFSTKEEAEKQINL